MRNLAISESVPPRGIEGVSVTGLLDNELRETAKQFGVNSGVTLSEIVSADPLLCRLAHLWPAIPTAARGELVALAESRVVNASPNLTTGKQLPGSGK